MASHNGWSVKIISIPESITVTELAQRIDLPDSRIYIPKINKYIYHYALIDDFPNEEEANEFAHQWSNSSIFDKMIECIVVAPNDDEADIIHSSRKSRFDKETKGTQENSDPPNRSISLLSTLTSGRTSNTTMDDIEKKAPLGRVHQSLNRQQNQHPTTNQISQQVDKSGTSSTKSSFKTQDAEDQRPLCRYANKGTCRQRSNECKYRHQRCKNYKSCSDLKCPLAHSSENPSSSDEEEYEQVRPVPYSSRYRNNSSSPMSSRQSINKKYKPCLSGIDCFNVNCQFTHPKGWNPCKDGIKCKNYGCTAKHPYNRKPKCRDGNNCKISDCLFLHPNNRPEKCIFHEMCKEWNCSKLHPHTRPQPCTNKENCKDPVCSCLHPPDTCSDGNPYEEKPVDIVTVMADTSHDPLYLKCLINYITKSITHDDDSLAPTPASDPKDYHLIPMPEIDDTISHSGRSRWNPMKAIIPIYQRRIAHLSPKYRNVKLEKIIDQNKTTAVVSLTDLNLICQDMEIVAYYLVRNNTTLTTLYLWNNQIKDQGVQYLSIVLEYNETLTALTFNNNQIGVKGAKYLSNLLKINQTLTLLSLANNQIGDEGVEHLSYALKTNKTLNNLFLFNNQIGDKGIQHLSNALQINKTLNKLDVQYNPIGDEGRQILEELKKKTSLELEF